MPKLIDKQAALDIAMSYCPDDDGCCSKACHDLREMLDEIEALPIVHIDDMAFNIQNEIQAKEPSRTVEITFVRHGRWISVKNGRGGHECDQCHNYAPSYQTGEEHLSDYCPNCGARMDATDTNVGGKGGADNG